MLRRTYRVLWILAAAWLGACATPPSQTGGPVPEVDGSHADPASAQPAAAEATTAPSRTRLARIPPLEPALDADGDDFEDEEFADLIERLRQGFGLPIVERIEVTRQAERFTQHPGYLGRVLERARPYLPHVAEEIEARGMPAELAFLPVIESAFDPFAYSHGSAAGLWQIIPSTGRNFGLKQNWWYDGRRDVVESTRAALDYLEYLHRMFDGDWLLAIAAYNCGEGTMLRAIRSNRAAGRKTDFWHLRLPAETRVYVPRLLGLVAVIAEPEAHGLALPEIPAAPAFTAVELDGQIDLAIAAELADIELSALQALNPGFNQWATDPEGPHRLLLPVEAAENFNTAVAELPAQALVRWQRHQIRPGETLGGLARRYGTTVEVLQTVNGLRGTMIRAGAYLMIPAAPGG